MKKYVVLFLALSLLFGCTSDKKNSETKKSDRVILSKSDLENGSHHTKHFEIFGKYTNETNQTILKAIDRVQATAMDGGGYFIGITADPPESPIGYDISLFDKELLKAPRKTSYCSGASYSAFIEALNLMYDEEENELSENRYESLRMQEPDGGRREDNVKFWGKWNADGYGNHFALVQYSKMGEVVMPKDAQPGDFMNISWKSGGGHSVIFLGWHINEENEKCLVYWSSQKGTNGLGDQVVKLSRIREVMVVRLTNPEQLFNFDPSTQIKNEVNGFNINW